MLNAIKKAVRVYQIEKEIDMEHKKAYRAKSADEINMHWERIDLLESEKLENLIEKRTYELLAA